MAPKAPEIFGYRMVVTDAGVRKIVIIRSHCPFHRQASTHLPSPQTTMNPTKSSPLKPANIALEARPQPKLGSRPTKPRTGGVTKPASRKPKPMSKQKPAIRKPRGEFSPLLKHFIPVLLFLFLLPHSLAPVSYQRLSLSISYWAHTPQCQSQIHIPALTQSNI